MCTIWIGEGARYRAGLFNFLLHICNLQIDARIWISTAAGKAAKSGGAEETRQTPLDAVESVRLTNLIASLNENDNVKVYTNDSRYTQYSFEYQLYIKI